MVAKDVARKSFEWPREFSEELASRRIDWNLEDPTRVHAQQGLTSENVFVIAMLKLAVEALDEPQSSKRLWEIVQQVGLSAESRS